MAVVRPTLRITRRNAPGGNDPDVAKTLIRGHVPVGCIRLFGGEPAKGSIQIAPHLCSHMMIIPTTIAASDVDSAKTVKKRIRIRDFGLASCDIVRNTDAPRCRSIRS